MELVERRTSAWLAMVGELLADPVRSAGFPRDVVAGQLAATFDCKISWNWLDPDGGQGYHLHTPIPGWPSPEIAQNISVALSQHPCIRWYAVTGDPAPMTIGRVPRRLVTRRGVEVVRDYLEPFDLDQQLSIPYRLSSSSHRAFVLARGGDDFSEDDVRTAGRIQTLLLLLDRQSAVLGRTTTAGRQCGLTGRELAVLRLLADGLTATAIARRLAISPRTVHQHLQNTYRKLGVTDRLRAVLTAREAGLLDGGTQQMY